MTALLIIYGFSLQELAVIFYNAIIIVSSPAVSKFSFQVEVLLHVVTKGIYFISNLLYGCLVLG